MTTASPTTLEPRQPAVVLHAVVRPTETSEERHGITPQPPPGCPLIDDAISAMDKVLRKTHNYEKCKHECDIEELHAMLWEVEYTVSDYCGRGNKLDAIRQRLEEVRAWGEEWKQYALEIAKRESA